MRTSHLPLVSGVSPVVETPFLPDGEIDEASFANLLDHLVKVGVTSVMYPGFASEVFKLTEPERDRLLAILLGKAVEHPPLRVIVSIPDYSTHVASQRAAALKDSGAAALNVLPPRGPAGTPQNVLSHVESVLSAAYPLPCILQYAPAETGISLTGEDIGRLTREHDNLAQVKVESTPPGRLISALRPFVHTLVGYGGVQMIDALHRGAAGVQPGSSFVEIYLEIWNRWVAGDADGARGLHARLLPYISYWMQNVELIIAAEKVISFRRGLIASPHCRQPAWQLDDAELRTVERFLRAFAEELATSP